MADFWPPRGNAQDSMRRTKAVLTQDAVAKRMDYNKKCSFAFGGCRTKQHDVERLQSGNLKVCNGLDRLLASNLPANVHPGR